MQYQAATGTPGITTCENAALTTPLLFDPGERWEYGINIDWVGKIVEAVSGQMLGDYLQHTPLCAARDAQHLVPDFPVAAGTAGQHACAWSG